MSQHSQNNAIATQGAGILCFHNKMPLLVQLNYGRFKGHWILPGGMLEPGEHPHEAALREFEEETGLCAELGGLLILRHRIYDDKSNNNYWVFHGNIKTKDPENSLKWPEEELQCVRFWDLNEALNSESVRPHTKYYINLYLGNEKPSEGFYSMPGPYNDFGYSPENP